ncbi:MAG: tetratricopeptide repeat protein [Bacteroidales bacterium]|nr:tetratricopeptide repeat protein [Bacteroidales bacterium]
MNKYSIKIQLLLLIFLFLNKTTFSQTSNKIFFDSIYNNTLELFEKTRDISQENINKARTYTLNDIQEAKINFIKTRIALLYEVDPLFKSTPIIFNETSDTSTYEEKLLFQAQQYTNKSMPDNAIPLLFEILDNVDADSDIALKSKIYLAEAYREKREYHKGIFIIQEALQNDNLSLKNKAFAYNRIAALYNEMGDPQISTQDTVIKYSELCIQISEKELFNDYIASSQNELGFVFEQQQRYSEAIEYCTKAVEGFIKQNKLHNAMNASINLSSVYIALNNFEKANSVIDDALELCDVNENKNLFMRLYLQKADIYTRMSKYKTAYDFLSLARIMQNDFYHDRMRLQINEMSAKYELQLKESEIIEEQHKNKIQKQQKTYLFVILLVLITVLIFVIFNFRLKRKIRLQNEKIVKQENTELKTILEFKEKELNFKAKELSQAIANIISYNETLRKIKKSLPKTANRETLSILNNNLRTNQNWEKFKLTFNNLYPSFFTKINEIFTSLTENEIKLCAFLIMDLKTREIADIMNISETSVSKNRNRLRKKLQLESGTDIAVYLKTI